MQDFVNRRLCFASHRIAVSTWLGITLLSLVPGGIANAQDAADKPPAATKAPFRTFFVTRSLAHERLLEYLQAARPEIVQVGNYGAMFHGYADDPRSTRTPMMLPVVGQREALAFQRELNSKVHELGLKVVGHFRLVKVMGNWQQQSGFVEYYNRRWPADLLGPKPHKDLRELLQRDADGTPIQTSRYNNAQLAFCLSSPHARQMFKQMLRCAVDRGVDGVITTYNYCFNCACPHCQQAFKTWLARHYTTDQLRDKLGIADLEKHKFASIPARIPGYPDPAEATELDWLAMRWAAEHFKRMYDDIFLDYGRSLNKDLLVAQWDHLSHVSLKEERMFLPLKLWGRGEDYFWYSGGASFVGKNLNLAQGKAGDAWLSSLYVRELSGNKPFVMGKYDRIRMAASMAEGYATGGMGMGRYMRFEDPIGFDVLVRYTNFMHQHRDLYDGARRWADAALLLPRQSVLARRPAALDTFRSLGQALLERQLLLDVVADQKLSAERLARYAAIIVPGSTMLSPEQAAALNQYAADGGMLLAHGMDTSTLPKAIGIQHDEPAAAADAIGARLRARGATSIRSSPHVRAAAYTQPGRVILHLVNYNRNEQPAKGVNGPALERPIPAEDVSIDLALPQGHQASNVKMHTPEANQPMKLQAQFEGNRVTFRIPRFGVYAVIAVE